MTYGQMLNCIEAYEEKMEERAMLADAANHSLGMYVRLAMHAKRYPDKPFSARSRSSGKAFTDDSSLDRYIAAHIDAKEA